MTSKISSKHSIFVLAAAAALLVLICFAYFLYATKGWFHQDDFGFIVKFSDSLHVSELWATDGFGRFLTQNVYWHFGLNVLGRNAELFFFVNAMTVAATGSLVFLLARSVVGMSGAMVAVFFYIANPRVVHTYSWISNSQHLIAHLFSIGFLVLLLRRRGSSMTTKESLLLIGIFAIANISNSFSIALLAPILWQLLDSERRSSNPYRILVAGTLSFGALTVVRAWNSAEGPYEVDLSIDVLRTNAEAYLGSTIRFVVWLAGSAVAAVLLARKSRLTESTMFVCSIAFFIPFAFLVQQRFPQYGVMTLLFLLLGCWMPVHRFVTARSRSADVALSVLVTVFVSVQGMQEFSVRLSEPFGYRARHLVDDLREVIRPEDSSISKYCFDHEPVLDSNGNATSLPPAAWWWVGHGSAFSLFVDGTKSYQLSSRTDDCERTLFISSESVSGQG